MCPNIKLLSKFASTQLAHRPEVSMQVDACINQGRSNTVVHEATPQMPHSQQGSVTGLCRLQNGRCAAITP